MYSDAYVILQQPLLRIEKFSGQHFQKSTIEAHLIAAVTREVSFGHHIFCQQYPPYTRLVIIHSK